MIDIIKIMEKDFGKSFSDTITSIRSKGKSSWISLGHFRIVIIVDIIAIIILIVGLICLLQRVPKKGNPEEIICEKVPVYDYKRKNSLEYSKCESSEAIPCHNSSSECSCVLDMDVTESIYGEIVLGYSLDTFNDTRNAEFYQSRDNNQLNGKLSSNVSELCEPFAYNNNKPIAPCGALANAMYTDQVLTVYNIDNVSYPIIVPQIQHGLLRDEEKKGFRNPDNENRNLSVAFQSFSKPIAWKKNIWELDLNSPENNGLRNDAFIVWMRTDLKIKPLWRLNRTGEFKEGLRKGKYAFVLKYDYPSSMYNGSRHLILYEETKTEKVQCLNSTGVPDSDTPLNSSLGITCLVFFAILAIAERVLMWRLVKEKAENGGKPTHAQPETDSIVTLMEPASSSDKRGGGDQSGKPESQLLEVPINTSAVIET